MIAKPRLKKPEELAPKAEELAYQEAEERGLPIDRICIQANAVTGKLKAIVLPPR